VLQWEGTLRRRHQATRREARSLAPPTPTSPNQMFGTKNR